MLSMQILYQLSPFDRRETSKAQRNQETYSRSHCHNKAKLGCEFNYRSFQGRVAQLQHYYFGLDNPLHGGAGAVLGIVGCLAASLTSTHQMPAVPPSQQVATIVNVSRHCQIFTGKIKSALVYNHCPKTPVLTAVLFCLPFNLGQDHHSRMNPQQACHSPCMSGPQPIQFLSHFTQEGNARRPQPGVIQDMYPKLKLIKKK